MAVKPGASEGSSMAERSEVLSLSNIVLRAICSHDRQALEAILSPDFYMLGDSQRTPRFGFLDAVASGSFVAINAGFESIDIEVFGTVAVAAGIQRVEVELPNGTRALSRGIFTDVFVNQSGRWLLRMAHSVDLS